MVGAGTHGVSLLARSLVISLAKSCLPACGESHVVQVPSLAVLRFYFGNTAFVIFSLLSESELLVSVFGTTAIPHKGVLTGMCRVREKSSFVLDFIFLHGLRASQ